MRMAIYKLVTKEIDYINYIEALFFLADLGIEYHMEKYITQLLGQFIFLALKDRITLFIHLFQSLRTQRLIGLFPVPRALLSQFIQHIQYPSECLKFFLSCMHNSINSDNSQS